MTETGKWYGNGKLLLTGEYLVIEGAKALALPIIKGQSLEVGIEPDADPIISWQAFEEENPWFTAKLNISHFGIVQTDHDKLAGNLGRILQETRNISPDFLRGKGRVNVKTQLDFHTEFGFGSSSTLISNLAFWADIDPYELLKNTFGGSGYDIACARVDSPLFFQLENNQPKVETVDFKPSFTKYIYFVYLGKKQKSTESISSFKQSAKFTSLDVDTVSKLSEEIVVTKALEDFEDLLVEHERLLSSILSRPTIKSQLFTDYPGVVKSLGGWGGDFVLVTSRLPELEFRNDMHKRGYSVIFGYDELVLKA